MVKVLHIFKQVEELRQQYATAAYNKDALMQVLQEAEIYEHVYNSNAIENSTLSLEETEKILLQIDLERFISEREIFEAKNLARVMQYVYSHAQFSSINVDMILLLHKMLLSNINEGIAGRLRIDNEYVRVGSYIAPPPTQIAALLESMNVQYASSYGQHIVSRIARFHLEFEHIHPFVDGNGRIGRVLNNLLLIKEGYVPMNIKFIDRALYYKAFKEYDADKKIRIMEEIVGKAICNSFHKRLAYLRGAHIIPLQEYAAIHHMSYSNLLNKAGRQTIPAFLEKNAWKIASDAKYS